jgi:hypothetical protein
MSSSTLGLIELALVFGGVFVFGFWQLWSLRRERDRQRERAAEQAVQGDEPAAAQTLAEPVASEPDPAKAQVKRGPSA